MLNHINHYQPLMVCICSFTMAQFPQPPLVAVTPGHRASYGEFEWDFAGNFSNAECHGFPYGVRKYLHGHTSWKLSQTDLQ